MKSKLIFLMLFSFAIVACENIFNDDDENGNGQDSRLFQTMERMSTAIGNVNTTNDPDQDFALKMKVHHRGAIDMANIEILRGDEENVLAIADSIIDAHTLEITKLDSFLNAHAVVVDTVNGKDFNEASDVAIEKLDSLIKVKTLNDETDHDFLVLMIEHHKSGVELADAELEYGKEEDFKALVTKMREGALREIDILEDMLENY